MQCCGSGSFIHKKTPVIQIFALYKFVKLQFRPINFLSLILSVIRRCLDLEENVKKKLFF